MGHPGQELTLGLSCCLGLHRQSAKWVTPCGFRAARHVLNMLSLEVQTGARLSTARCCATCICKLRSRQAALNGKVVKCI